MSSVATGADTQSLSFLPPSVFTLTDTIPLIQSSEPCALVLQPTSQLTPSLGHKRLLSALPCQQMTLSCPFRSIGIFETAHCETAPGLAIPATPDEFDFEDDEVANKTASSGDEFVVDGDEAEGGEDEDESEMEVDEDEPKRRGKGGGKKDPNPRKAVSLVLFVNARCTLCGRLVSRPSQATKTNKKKQKRKGALRSWTLLPGWEKIIQGPTNA
ncbi:hypothetical protein GSI_09323 [Ganoderma sinense ZZ0214-1]|uniref:Uncharacterized protein n=1 Tax=Ganoderma sinense ZZ0214-1 TaxID=1077348 RepID=A0A2G8S679_9APHY|nr:hypothetical protein GSI_09323 [Ganoderma sinense ZZ0214-1]